MKTVFENTVLLFEKPLTISQISFEKKKAVQDHMLMVGDAAGLIHPFCGNGMAMAIHAAKIASELLIAYKAKQITRSALEKKYTVQWNDNFNRRLKTGRLLSKLLQKRKIADVVLQLCIVFPSLLAKLIKRTHGKEILQSV